MKLLVLMVVALFSVTAHAAVGPTPKKQINAAEVLCLENEVKSLLPDEKHPAEQPKRQVATASDNAG